MAPKCVRCKQGSSGKHPGGRRPAPRWRRCSSTPPVNQPVAPLASWAIARSCTRCFRARRPAAGRKAARAAALVRVPAGSTTGATGAAIAKHCVDCMMVAGDVNGATMWQERRIGQLCGAWGRTAGRARWDPPRASFTPSGGCTSTPDLHYHPRWFYASPFCNRAGAGSPTKPREPPTGPSEPELVPIVPQQRGSLGAEG